MIFRFDGYEIDSARYELRRDGAAVPLEPKVLDSCSISCTSASGW